jgi:predicted transcriptional regulator
MSKLGRSQNAMSVPVPTVSLHLRVVPDLKNRISKIAIREGRSENSIVSEVLSKYVERKKDVQRNERRDGK